MHDGIAKRVSHPKMQEMLGYFSKYVGSSPYDAPAVLNMMIYMQHAQGDLVCAGGMHKIAEGIVKLGKEIGVTFHTGVYVEKLNIENDQIRSARLADGTVIEADYFCFEYGSHPGL